MDLISQVAVGIVAASVAGSFIALVFFVMRTISRDLKGSSAELKELRGTINSGLAELHDMLNKHLHNDEHIGRSEFNEFKNNTNEKLDRILTIIKRLVDRLG